LKNFTEDYASTQYFKNLVENDPFFSTSKRIHTDRSVIEVNYFDYEITVHQDFLGISLIKKSDFSPKLHSKACAVSSSVRMRCSELRHHLMLRQRELLDIYKDRGRKNFLENQKLCWNSYASTALDMRREESEERKLFLLVSMCKVSMSPFPVSKMFIVTGRNAFSMMLSSSLWEETAVSSTWETEAFYYGRAGREIQLMGKFMNIDVFFDESDNETFLMAARTENSDPGVCFEYDIIDCNSFNETLFDKTPIFSIRMSFFQLGFFNENYINPIIRW